MVSFLFRPSTMLMERLNYSKKILLIGSIFIISLTILSFNLYLHIKNSIEQSTHHLMGLDKLTKTTKLLQYSQQYRGLSSVVKNGDEEFNFTDGCGNISKELARMIAKKLGYENSSAF